MQCPDCKGSGKNIADHVRYADGSSVSNVPLRCSRCVGAGFVPDEMAAWIIKGRSLRNARLASNRSLREEANRRGMAPMLLSRMEFGKVEPKWESEVEP